MNRRTRDVESRRQIEDLNRYRKGDQRFLFWNWFFSHQSSADGSLDLDLNQVWNSSFEPVFTFYVWLSCQIYTDPDAHWYNFEQYVVQGILSECHFWSRKVFEGVHSHVMELLRKCDFGPLNFSSKFMITCPNSIWDHFSTVRISVQSQLEVRIWTKLWNSKYWKLDQNQI